MDRAQQHRLERLSEALRDEISTLLEGELADPRIGLATVTEVHLGPGGRSARVMVSVHGSDEDAARTMKALAAARNYVRREVMESLGLRRAPELIFELDKSEQYGARIEQLLERVKKRRS